MLRGTYQTVMDPCMATRKNTLCIVVLNIKILVSFVSCLLLFKMVQNWITYGLKKKIKLYCNVTKYIIDELVGRPKNVIQYQSNKEEKNITKIILNKN